MLCTLWDTQEIHDKLEEERKQGINRKTKKIFASIKSEQSFENVLVFDRVSKITLNMRFKISLTVGTSM